MKALERLFRKKRKLIVGLMSGTSADGIDATLVEIRGNGTRSRIQQIEFQTYPYPLGFKHFLLKNSDASTAHLDDIARLDMLVAMFFADAAKKIVLKAGLRAGNIDLIGSHGQTIHHLPTKTRLFGKELRATMQIGSPSTIAKLTGVVTVGDFRVGDVAVGGSGAPLVPLFDFIVLRSKTSNRAALNIGGIANITVLPKNCSIDDVIAFDTGPGNMVVDRLMQKFYKKSYDKNGEVAAIGNILSPLLDWMTKHPYLSIRPPKSTGRETFGETFVRDLLREARGKKPEDVIATATEFTALCVYLGYLKFIRRRTKLDELLVSGGGTHNAYMMGALERYFDGVMIRTTDETNLSPDAKEAICFALLANETIAGYPGNVPGATGARRQTILGTICLP